MKPKILSWNIWGLNDPNRRFQVKNLLRHGKMDIVCLQEIKLNFIDRSIITSLWGCPFVGWVYLASNAVSGGILIMWDRRVVESIGEYTGNYTVVWFKNVVGGFS
ncbi:hypothetical protein CIPAW_13G135200 [Carya illinoinensis]|uniref:Endonuclease/exonuclease/phosphatase domain-containing protein n=1 Tax=Carya illinoinensis TaxID=32201 RepID=A0A8T1NTN8_CARIL|nr:hypothetical protein CIPAW_13G135200 [Carya illinoinensis]